MRYQSATSSSSSSAAASKHAPASAAPWNQPSPVPTTNVDLGYERPGGSFAGHGRGIPHRPYYTDSYSGGGAEGRQPPDVQQRPLPHTEYGPRNMSPQLARHLALRESPSLVKCQQTCDRLGRKEEEMSQELERLERDQAELVLRHSEEVNLYVQENENLRLQLNALTAEVAGLGESQVAQEATIQMVSEQLRQAERGLTERDSELANLTHLLGVLPAENKRLAQENQMLVGRAEDRPRDDRSEEIKALLKQLDGYEQQLTHFKDAATVAEKRAAELSVNKRTLLELEGELQESRGVTERQRKEIERLYGVIETLNREKAVAPPVVSLMHSDEVRMLKDKIMSRDESGESEKHQLLDKILARFERANQERVRTDDVAAQQLKALQEQRNLTSMLLDGLKDVGVIHGGRTPQEAKSVSDFESPCLHALVERQPSAVPPLLRDCTVTCKDCIMKIVYNPERFRGFVPTYTVNLNESTFRLQPGLQRVIVYNHVPTNTESERPDKDDVVHIVQFSRPQFYEGFSDYINSRVKGVSKPKDLKAESELPVRESLRGGSPPSYQSIVTSPTTNLHPKMEAGRSTAFSLMDDGKRKVVSPARGNSKMDKAWRASASATPSNSSSSSSSSESASSLEEVGPGYSSKSAKAGEKAKATAKPIELSTTKPPTPKRQTPTPRHVVFVVTSDKITVLADPARPARQPLMELERANAHVVLNDIHRELILVQWPGTPDEESYTFIFDDNVSYAANAALFKELGLVVPETIENLKRTEVCVVEKGTLKLFDNFLDDEEPPKMALTPIDSEATINEETREVRIVRTLPNGKRERLTLDCANLDELTRWKTALNIGTFLGRFSSFQTLPIGFSVVRYTFPVNLGGGHEGQQKNQRAIVVNDRELQIFSDAEAKDPVYIAQRAATTVCVSEPSLQLRILRTDSDREVDQLELNFIGDHEGYHTLLKSLELHSYNIDNAQLPQQKYEGWVLAREGALELHETPDEERVVQSLSSSSCKADVDMAKLILRLIPQDTRIASAPMDLSSEYDAQRWTIAANVANIPSNLPRSEQLTPKLKFTFHSKVATNVFVAARHPHVKRLLSRTESGVITLEEGSPVRESIAIQTPLKTKSGTAFLSPVLIPQTKNEGLPPPSPAKKGPLALGRPSERGTASEIPEPKRAADRTEPGMAASIQVESKKPKKAHGPSKTSPKAVELSPKSAMGFDASQRPPNRILEERLQRSAQERSSCPPFSSSGRGQAGAPGDSSSPLPKAGSAVAKVKSPRSPKAKKAVKSPKAVKTPKVKSFSAFHGREFEGRIDVSDSDDLFQSWHDTSQENSGPNLHRYATLSQQLQALSSELTSLGSSDNARTYSNGVSAENATAKFRNSDDILGTAKFRNSDDILGITTPFFPGLSPRLPSNHFAGDENESGPHGNEPTASQARRGRQASDENEKKPRRRFLSWGFRTRKNST